MSNPSFSNIDLWLFELAEGNLSQTQVEQLELFLLQNPDLDVDRDVWDMSKVNAVPVVYPDQAGLNKEKPSRRFALIGSSALLLLTLVGCLGYLGFKKTEIPNDNSVIASNDNKKSQEELELLSEIRDLKSTIASLESEVAKSQSENEANTASSNELPSLTILNNGFVPSQGNAAITSNTGANMAPGSLLTNAGVGVVSTANSANVISSNTALATSNNLQNQLGNGLLAEATVKQLQTNEAEYIPTSFDNTERSVNSSTRSQWGGGSGHSEYHNSMKNRMSRFARNVQRMMDNPIALKNSRDPHFHVPGMSAQDLNLGSVGTLISPRVQSLSRLQWYGESNEQFTNQLSFDGYSYAMRGGVGLQLNHAMYNKGGIHVANATFSYSPKISVNRTISIEPAIRFKMGNKLLSDADMDDATQVEIDRGNVQEYYNDGTQPVGRSLWYKDLGAGLNVNTKWFFVSAQFDNLFNHRDNIYSNDLTDPRRAGTHFVSTIGTDWESKKENHKGRPVFGASPYLLYQKNEQLSEGWLGLNGHWHWLTLGGAVSSNMDVAASIGVKTERFSIHFNSDYSYSLMNDKRALSHQVTLRLLGKPSRFGKRLLNL